MKQLSCYKNVGKKQIKKILHLIKVLPLQVEGIFFNNRALKLCVYGGTLNTWSKSESSKCTKLKLSFSFCCLIAKRNMATLRSLSVKGISFCLKNCCKIWLENSCLVPFQNQRRDRPRPHGYNLKWNKTDRRRRNL